MKFYAAILFLITASVQAEDIRSLRVQCDDTNTVMNTLKERFNEVPVVAGRSPNPLGSTISVWGNPLTNTFTILHTMGNTTCVLGVGDDFTILLTEGKDV